MINAIVTGVGVMLNTPDEGAMGITINRKVAKSRNSLTFVLRYRYNPF